MRNGRKLLLGIAMGAMILGTGSPTWAAEEDAQKSIEARQQLMKGIGGEVRALREMLEGTGTPAEGSARAEAISEAAGQIALLFKPEHHVDNVAGLETAAKAEIWTDYEDFTAKAEALKEASTNLALAAQTEDMDQIRTAFADMSKTCGACHQTYRVPRN